jgi:hypothetical protein
MSSPYRAPFLRDISPATAGGQRKEITLIPTRSSRRGCHSCGPTVFLGRQRFEFLVSLRQHHGTCCLRSSSGWGFREVGARNHCRSARQGLVVVSSGPRRPKNDTIIGTTTATETGIICSVDTVRQLFLIVVQTKVKR